MSGALIELVAKGAQDAYLTGEPQVSFFHQTYKRHTNFAQKPVPVQYTGTAVASQQINMKLTNKGDLLSYVWMDLGVGTNTAGTLEDTIFELYIGGQLIDRQDGFYMVQLWQKFLLDSSAKGFAGQGDNTNTSTPLNSVLFATWLPLHFFFCDSMCYLPLVALQYHEVEVRITFGNNITIAGPINIYANYVVLDTAEREAIVNKEHNLLIEQVQRIESNSPPALSGNNKFDLSFLNHPVKCLLWGSNRTALANKFFSNTVQLYLNGTELFEKGMPDVYFRTVQNYYHSEFASILQGNQTGYTVAVSPSTVAFRGGFNLKMYSFALKANKHQPCGTCNFSRIDTASLTFGSVTNAPTNFYLYAVNFNILRIKAGLSGLAFSN